MKAEINPILLAVIVIITFTSLGYNAHLLGKVKHHEGIIYDLQALNRYGIAINEAQGEIIDNFDTIVIVKCKQ